MAYARFAILLTASLLAGCAGGQLTTDKPAPEQTASTTPAGMTGRWFLAAPNAPPCGMGFGGGPQQGRLVPEGGCPGRLFLSRRWALDGETLTISDEDSQPLGTLKQAGAQFEGQAVTGMALTLSR